MSDTTSRTRTTTAVVLIANFMCNLDLWVVNVAVTAIGNDLPGSSLDGLSWVINGYAIAIAALLIVSGRAADRYGVTRVFQVGLIVFTAASVLCAAAPNLGFLIGFRVLQGIGGAMITTASLGLLLSTTAPDARPHAVRTWAAVGALAAATGPTIGGLLVTLDWRWVFLINLPIGVVAVLLTWRRVPHLAGQHGAPHPDVVSALLLSAGVAALVAEIVEVPQEGWTTLTILLAAAVLVAACLFVWRSRVHRNPLVAPAVFRGRGFGLANTAMLAFSGAFGIMLLSNSLWLQNVWHYGPVRTGLAMAPGPLMVPLTTAVLRRVGTRIRPITFVAWGGAIFAAGMVWGVLLRTAQPAYVGVLLPQLIAGGIGVGLAMGNLLATGAATVPSALSGAGSGILNTSRQIGSSLGVAIVVTALASLGQSVRGFDIAWGVAAGAAILTTALAIAMRLRAGRTDPVE
ncbi:DHA2 family efflux MFS transporter permease subunit [Curtobacterium pusillum]|uniref:DHA2 family efflux MFS transporter permease subunit n=1 Tax=Curtobacterium pusillum TaxID=69373 RepID=UPI0011A612E9|nr:DHA2 family efflux MFS transporter permease subunit [Curtobacterium pusillum]